jgi:hypothetical protein
MLLENRLHVGMWGGRTVVSKGDAQGVASPLHQAGFSLQPTLCAPPPHRSGRSVGHGVRVSERDGDLGGVHHDARQEAAGVAGGDTAQQGVQQQCLRQRCRAVSNQR